MSSNGNGHSAVNQTEENLADVQSRLEVPAIEHLPAEIEDISGRTQKEMADIAGPHLFLTDPEDVKSTEVEWLWEGRIPRGKLVNLVGDADTGKSQLCCQFTALVSTGRAFPDERGIPGQGPSGTPRSVICLSGEDDYGNTVKPRLEKAGADMAYVHLADGAMSTEDGEGCLTLSDVGVIRRAVREAGAALLVIDVMDVFMPGVDAHRSNDVRPILGGLRAVAAESGCTILGIRHIAKSANGKAIHAGLGSVAFTAAARSELLVALDPDDDSRQRRILKCSKHNLAPDMPALMYEIDRETGEFRWAGVADVRPDEMVSAPEPDQRGKLQDAVEWLEDYLSGGPVLAEDVKQAAAKRDPAISTKTLYRALSKVGISEKGKGDGKYEWVLLAKQDGQANSFDMLANMSKRSATEGLPAKQDGQLEKGAQAVLDAFGGETVPELLPQTEAP